MCVCVDEGEWRSCLLSKGSDSLCFLLWRWCPVPKAGPAPSKISGLQTLPPWQRCQVEGSDGEGSGTPLQYSCLENPMDGGAWWAAVHGVARSRTWLSDFTLFFPFHALEKEMATHSSVLAWRIPGTGEHGGLPSMESNRVGHDWSDLAAAAAEGSEAQIPIPEWALVSPHPPYCLKPCALSVVHFKGKKYF